MPRPLQARTYSKGAAVHKTGRRAASSNCGFCLIAVAQPCRPEAAIGPQWPCEVLLEAGGRREGTNASGMCWLLGLTSFEGRATVNDNLPAHAALGQEGGGFLAGGGEMGALIRSHDWTNSLLGAPETWSPALRMMVGFMLANRFPLLLWWGPQYVSLYNDAYRPILGTKHPWALGQPVSECWKEIWHILQPLIDTPFHGGPATWMEDISLEINRYGFVEETHFTVAYSPVPDDTAPRGIGGVLATVHEITEKVIGERRGVILRDLGARAGEAKTAEEACAIAAKALAKHSQDVPFALLYLIDPESKQARLAGATGVGDAVAPSVAGLDEDQTWPLAEAIRTERMQVVEDIGERFDTVPLGPWSDPPHTAVVLPIPSNKAHQMAGLLVAGISSRLKLDEQYRSFLELMTTQIATAVANARAYEEERKRAEALAEIDRAKTLFFSNVSHEVIDHELAAAVEEVGERLLALRPLERIGLVDPDPGQLAPLGAQIIAQAREFLLLAQMLLARGKPFVARHDSRLAHPCSPLVCHIGAGHGCPLLSPWSNGPARDRQASARKVASRERRRASKVRGRNAGGARRPVSNPRRGERLSGRALPLERDMGGSSPSGSQRSASSTKARARTAVDACVCSERI